MNNLTTPHQILACESCDLLIEGTSINSTETGHCPRCGAIVLSSIENSIDKTLITSLAGLLFFIPAVFFPLLTMDAMGLQEQGSIIQGFFALYETGFPLVAVVLLLTSVLLPLTKHSLLFYVSFCLKRQYYPPQLEYCLRLYHHLKEWGMDEVYLIGLMVTLIKVYAMAGVIYEIGFFAFLGLVASTVGLSLCYDQEYYWTLIETHRNGEVK